MLSMAEDFWYHKKAIIDGHEITISLCKVEEETIEEARLVHHNED